MGKTAVARVVIILTILVFGAVIPAAALAGQWTAPVAMPVGAVNPTTPAIDDDGTLTAMWVAGTSDACDSSYTLPGCEIRVARRGGAGWSDPVTLSTGDAYAGGATVTVDATGAVTAMWIQTGGMGYGTSVYASRFTGGAWSPAVRLSAPGGSLMIFYTALVVAKDGSVFAVWDDDVSQRAQFARFANGGWSPAAEVPSGGRPTTYIDALVASPDGSVTALLRQTGDRIGAARFANGVWTDEGLISPPGRPAYGGDAVVDASGTVTAAWHSNISGHYQIEVVRRVGGTWGSVTQISSAVGHAQSPKVVIASDGAPVAVWDDKDGSYSNTQIAYARFAGGSWSAPTAIGSFVDQSTVNALAVDASGDPFLLASVFDLVANEWSDVSLSYSGGRWSASEALVPGVAWDAGFRFAMNAHGSGVAIGYASGHWDAQQVVRFGGLPAAPKAARGTGRVASIDAQWDAAPPSDALPVSAYVATASPGGQSCTAVGVTHCTIDGLKTGVTYRVTVSARNELGVGQASTPSDPIALSPVAISLTNIVATATGSNAAVRVSITVPGAGKVTLTGTTPGVGSSTRSNAAAPVWRCTSAATFAKAGKRALTCHLRARARRQLRRGAMHFTFRAHFVPTSGTPVTAVKAVTISRHR